MMDLDASSVVWNDDLFSGRRVAPFLMASGLSDEDEPVMFEDRDYLISSQARYSAFTQSLPQRVWHRLAIEFPTVRDRA